MAYPELALSPGSKDSLIFLGCPFFGRQDLDVVNRGCKSCRLTFRACKSSALGKVLQAPLDFGHAKLVEFFLRPQKGGVATMTLVDTLEDLEDLPSGHHVLHHDELSYERCESYRMQQSNAMQRLCKRDENKLLRRWVGGW